MDVSIIIVNYKTPKLTIQCVRSIIEKTIGVTYEIIVVDNASKDGTVQRLGKEFPYVHVIENDQNIGFGRANNKGFAVSKGDYVFLLNSDTVLINDAITLLVNFMRENPSVFIAGGRLLDSSMNEIHSFGCFFPSCKKELQEILTGIGCNFYEQRTRRDAERIGYAKVAYITGADMMLRHENAKTHGLFDEDYFMYYEETDLAYRYNKKGMSAFYYPKAEIMHLEGQSSRLNKKRTDMQMKSRKLFFKKHHSSLYLALCNAILIFGLSVKVLLMFLTGQKESLRNSAYRISKVW